MKHGVSTVRKIVKTLYGGKYAKSADRIADLSDTSVESNPPCVTSFSSQDDLLSQWRAYGGACGGYAIGFNCDAIREVFPKKMGRFRRCRYTESDQRALVEDYWRHWEGRFSAARSGSNGEEDNGNAEVQSLILRIPVEIVPFLKNESFREEKEWRGVVAANMNNGVKGGGIKFREKGNELVPYVEVRLPSPLPVKRIVVGPCPRPKESEDSVKLFLRTHGLEHVEVAQSKCPYRGWP
jgi:hypothetical protein